VDEALGGPLKLRPANLSAAIDAELAIVDELPNYQMLMGKPPAGGETPLMKKGGNGPAFSLSKVERCRRYLAEFAADAELTEAYTAKLNKELSAANQLFSADAMQAAYAKAEQACRQLEQRLASSGSFWLLGHSVTLADLFWGVELLRMKNLGAAHFWEQGRLPRVERYVHQVEDLPSIRSAVLQWPGALF
jgi:2,5-dichlorohydroquinone reductive dechlorinase